MWSTAGWGCAFCQLQHILCMNSFIQLSTSAMFSTKLHIYSCPLTRVIFMSRRTFIDCWELPRHATSSSPGAIVATAEDDSADAECSTKVQSVVLRTVHAKAAARTVMRVLMMAMGYSFNQQWLTRYWYFITISVLYQRDAQGYGLQYCTAEIKKRKESRSKTPPSQAHTQMHDKAGAPLVLA